MEFTFNGVIPNSIYFNNNDLNRVTCNGVTVWEKIPGVSQPLTMTANSASTVALSQVGTAPTVDLKYSLNNGLTWTQWDYSAISLTTGQSVCFKGLNTVFATGPSDYNKFVMTGSIAASGNIMSIIDDGACNTTTIPATYCFCDLFHSCTSLTTAPTLPATTLADYCYANMFWHCSGLRTAPTLPATTLAVGCYGSMFYYCTALRTAPALPATTLTDYCYRNMFYYCSSLRTAPALPATTLTESCYEHMFYFCSNLVSVPVNLLPATTLAYNCYYGMFAGCTSLTTAPALPATTLASYCYSAMFLGCTSLTTAPELLAPRLVFGCYQDMFNGCTNLNYIKCLATNINASGSRTNWVRNVAATGTFVKATSMTYWTTGDSGIPSGWTVQNA